MEISSIFSFESIRKFIRRVEFRKLEPIAFYGLMLVNLLPVLRFQFFPTLDGPAHLYNVQIISNLLSADPGIPGEYLQFNPHAVPNWLSHFLLLVFNIFLPSWLADKLLLVIVISILPFIIRRLALLSKVQNILLIYPVFLFTYPAVLIYGFYNFLLALSLMFCTIYLWIRNAENKTGAENLIILSILIASIYFAHLFIFLISLSLLTLYIFLDSLYRFENAGQRFTCFVRQTVKLLLCSALPLFFAASFIKNRDNLGQVVYLGKSDLIERLLHLDTIIMIDKEFESPYAMTASILIFGITAYILFKKFFNRHRNSGSHENSVLERYWIITIVFIFLLYFFVPDDMGNGSIVSIRLALVFFIALIVWMSTQKTPLWVGLIACSVIIFCHIKLLRFYYHSTAALNTIAANSYDCAKHIKEESIVFPVVLSDNWLLSHFSNYAGIDKNLLILENYEAATDHFPLIWKKDNEYRELVSTIYSGTSKNFEWHEVDSGKANKIDYFLLLGYKSSNKEFEDSNIWEFIRSEFELTYENADFRVFARLSRH